MRLGWPRGARWGREHSTGLCWWDQRRRLARGDRLAGPLVCLVCQQATGPACAKTLRLYARRFEQEAQIRKSKVKYKGGKKEGNVCRIWWGLGSKEADR